MRYMTVVLRVADNAEEQLVLDAIDRIGGVSLTAFAWSHALNERDDMMDALKAIHDYAHDNSAGPAVPDALWEVRNMAKQAI